MQTEEEKKIIEKNNEYTVKCLKCGSIYMSCTKECMQCGNKEK